MKLNNERRDIMTYATEIKKNHIYYCKNYMPTNWIIQKKLINSLETYNIWRLNHEKVESLDIHPKKPETLN